MNKINEKAKERETFSGEKAELCLLMLFSSRCRELLHDLIHF